MDINKLLDEPVVPGIRIGPFKLGDNISNYSHLFGGGDYDKWVTKAVYPNYFIYSLGDSLEVTVNIFLSRICRVTAKNKYTGRFDDAIGIGTTIGRLLENRKDVRFDMESVIVGDNYDAILRVNNDDDTIHSLEEILDNRITEITIENRGLF